MRAAASFPMAAAGAALALLLVACAGPQSRVVLLPQAGAPSSAVVLRSADAERLLDRPYQRATVASDGRGPIRVDSTDAKAVGERFPLLISLNPMAPTHYTLYFVPGGTTLTAESEAQLQAALRDALARSGGSLVIVGHTDTTGQAPVNDALSLQRATAVRDMFAAQRFPLERMDVAGRGARQPAVPTADQVDEPRNRRVTVEVR